MPDWDAAIAASSAPVWSELCRQVQNQMASQTVAAWGDDWFQKNWNKNANALRRKIAAMLGKVVRPLMRKYKLPKSFEYGVTGDLLMICLEHEYGEVLTVDFFRKLAPWYLAGRFPCGWSGKLPREPRGPGKFKLAALPKRGKLIVF